jgi:hypothetical protein
MGTMALGAQRRYKRPTMGSFDVCFAVGAPAGGTAVTLVAAFGVRPWAQFKITTGLLGPCLVMVSSWIP